MPMKTFRLPDGKTTTDSVVCAKVWGIMAKRLQRALPGVYIFGFGSGFACRWEDQPDSAFDISTRLAQKILELHDENGRLNGELDNLAGALESSICKLTNQAIMGGKL